MKIYIVTSGCYSDYGIDKVFTDKQKAEEYAEWLEDSNDVEEYETDDNVSFEKLHNIHVQMKVYDNGKEDLSYRVYKTKDKCNSYTYLSDYHKYGGDYIDITLSRYVTNENFNISTNDIWIYCSNYYCISQFHIIIFLSVFNTTFFRYKFVMFP